MIRAYMIMDDDIHGENIKFVNVFDARDIVEIGRKHGVSVLVTGISKFMQERADEKGLPKAEVMLVVYKK